MLLDNFFSSTKEIWMKRILLGLVCLSVIACGKPDDVKSVRWRPAQDVQALKQVKMSGLHSGEKWEGKLALMYDAELLDEPALLFNVVAKTAENPCYTESSSKGIYVIVKKDKVSLYGDVDRYINFYDTTLSRYLASPNFEYQLKKYNGVIIN
jgi:hypothetical protein